MDGRNIEPRKVMWAVAEISWEDDGGTSFRVPAVLEDTSSCGACVRLKRPLAVGSRITIKWHREQFPAIARNCRTDGGDFLLGVRREAGIVPATKSASHAAAPDAKAERTLENPAATHATPTQIESPAPVHRIETAPAGVKPTPGPSRKPFPNAIAMAQPRLRTEIHTQGTPPRPERTVMQPKTMFPHFWRRKQHEDAPAKSKITEAPVNKPNTQEPTPSGPRGELLNYDDIYRAAGIMSPGSGYGIHKVVDMLNNDRIRDLSNGTMRASVPLAPASAGIFSVELLTSVTLGLYSVTSYEPASAKNRDDFKFVSAKENTRID